MWFYDYVNLYSLTIPKDQHTDGNLDLIMPLDVSTRLRSQRYVLIHKEMVKNIVNVKCSIQTDRFELDS